MSSNSIANILQDLNNSYSGETEKTAQAGGDPSGDASSSSSVDQTRQNLRDSLDTLTSSRSKEASVQNNEDATGTLEKLAGDLERSDLQATIKEAHTFGAAVFDGFVARANTYANGEGQAKTAAQHQNVKLAAQQQQQHVKTAASTGYQATGQILDGIFQQEKTASESEEQGIVDALEKVAAVSEDCFVRGSRHMTDLSQRLG